MLQYIVALKKFMDKVLWVHMKLALREGSLALESHLVVNFVFSADAGQVCSMLHFLMQKVLS